MSLINTAKSNANNLLSAVKELIEHAKFNKTFKAKIIGTLPNGKYKILYKNIEYPVTSEYQHSVGDSVWVCAPCNNWNELYIQSVNQNDNTELINQITELNGEITELETEITNLKTQLTQTNTNLSKLNTATLLTDCDTANDTGLYYYNGSTAHTPATNTFGFVRHSKVVSWNFQEAFPTGGGYYIRRKIDSGAWTAWTAI